MADLTCPKCESPMRSYERSGITVDQCSGCRGVFLDRGELERLVDAEGAYYEGGGKGGAEQRPRDDDDDDRRRDDDHRRRERDWDDDDDDRRRGGFGGLGDLGGFGGGQRHGKRRKKEGFLSELFD
jgi:Zn-finger nucleic acid-binding protein